MKTILLSQGKVAMVDDADYDAVSQYKWSAVCQFDKYWYAQRTFRYAATIDGLTEAHMSLQQFLMPGSQFVFHWDGNGLNNCRSNLHIATRAQIAGRAKKLPNCISRYKGVSLNGSGSWRARIRVGGRMRGLGTYGSEEEAAKAYDDAARYYFGEFARLNFGL